MRKCLLIAASLLCLVAAAPARAAAPPGRPHAGYQFAHGAVTHKRGWFLTLDIHTEDPANANNTGTFKVVFQAKMPQFVVSAFKDGSGIMDTSFEEITTTVNGSPVLHAIPDPFDAKTKVFHRYSILVNPNGTCNCSRLPAMIYDASGGYPHYVYLGDFLYYLHPSLPRSAGTQAQGWSTALSVPFTAKYGQTVALQSHLQQAKAGWTVVSHGGAKLSASFPASAYAAGHPHVTLSGAQVRVSGTVALSSTLTLLQNDGIGVVPLNATRNTKAKPCPSCTGYPLPLDGTEDLHILYSQGGTELSRIDVHAHLSISNL